MKYVVCAIRDRAADAYAVPVFVASRGSAIRSFSDLVNSDQKDNQVSSHPEDFDLYYLGMYDDSNGMFETGVPEMICIGKDVKVRSSGPIRAVN